MGKRALGMTFFLERKSDPILSPHPFFLAEVLECEAESCLLRISYLDLQSLRLLFTATEE